MKIKVLIEDTLSDNLDSTLIFQNNKLINEHGLSLYIETSHHKLLFDTGADDSLINNANVLGVSLEDVDTAVISHGHYDHGGGLKAFLKHNSKAPVYIRSNAFEGYWNITTDKNRYIGLDVNLTEMPDFDKRFKLIDGNYMIDNELNLITGFTGRRRFASTNRQLKHKRADGYYEDTFSHEQALVINDGGKVWLISGCAHNGILNILEEYERISGRCPDYVVSGMHLNRRKYGVDDLKEIDELAHTLLKYSEIAGTIFYTCHCTGKIPCDRMKNIMGENLFIIRTGDSF